MRNTTGGHGTAAPSRGFWKRRSRVKGSMDDRPGAAVSRKTRKFRAQVQRDSVKRPVAGITATGTAWFAGSRCRAIGRCWRGGQASPVRPGQACTPFQGLSVFF